jgi:hypothetical protein
MARTPRPIDPMIWPYAQHAQRGDPEDASERSWRRRTIPPDDDAALEQVAPEEEPSHG